MGQSNNGSNGRTEYSVSWIKARLYGYLQGKTDESTIHRDVESAKRYGVTKNHMQVITESLPFDRSSERFRRLLMILREVWR
jgi:hypothetical protein